MFCKSCGEKLNLNSNFCTKCGTKVNNLEKVVIEDNKIKYQIKPNFNLMYKLIFDFGMITVFVIILTFLLGLLIISKNAPGAIALAMLIILIITIVTIRLAIEHTAYNNYHYNFYKTKMEYKDGFLDKIQKELKYKHVREVVMSETFVERIFGIGTITIYTNASSFRNGIFIHCVKNVEEQYKIIKQIIDEGSDE